MHMYWQWGSSFDGHFHLERDSLMEQNNNIILFYESKSLQMEVSIKWIGS